MVAGARSAVEGLRGALRARPRRAAFLGVFAATLTVFLAIGAVLPILPRYVQGPLGSGDVAVSIVVGAFAFSAVAGRPIGGRWADAHGRKRIVTAGMAICVVAGLLYLLPLGVPGLVAARLVLGVGDGWVFTAGLSWIVDLAPEERRGQAIGVFGLSIWGGLAVGPLLGDAVFRVGSYDAVWLLAAALPLLGLAIARQVPDAHVAVPAARGAGSWLPRGVVAPGLALGLANVGYGTMAGFVVLLLADAGVDGGAAVFTAFATAVVLARVALARLPDALGPRATAAGAGVAEAAGLAILAVAGSLPVALAGAIVMGLGFSLLFPSLALVAVQRTGEHQRATALGAFTAFFDVGVGLGAPIAGAVSAAAGYEAAFLAAAAVAAAGVLVGLAIPPAGSSTGARA